MGWYKTRAGKRVGCHFQELGVTLSPAAAADKEEEEDDDDDDDERGKGLANWNAEGAVRVAVLDDADDDADNDDDGSKWDEMSNGARPLESSCTTRPGGICCCCVCAFLLEPHLY